VWLSVHGLSGRAHGSGNNGAFTLLVTLEVGRRNLREFHYACNYLSYAATGHIAQIVRAEVDGLHCP
jgi:hypothetical protein